MSFILDYKLEIIFGICILLYIPYSIISYIKKINIMGEASHKIYNYFDAIDLIKVIFSNSYHLLAVLILIVKYKRTIRAADALKISNNELLQGFNPTYHLYIVVIASIVFIIGMIISVLDSIYQKKIRFAIYRDKIIINGIKFDIKNMNFYYWNENKLIIERDILFHKRDKIEIEVPYENKVSIDKKLKELNLSLKTQD